MKGEYPNQAIGGLAQAQREPLGTRVANDLERQVTRLATAAEQLARRLTPVLQQEPPSELHKDATAEEWFPPLLDNIRGHTKRVADTAELLEDLFRRLEV